MTATVVALAGGGPVSGQDFERKVWQIHCDAGETIGKALEKARPGDTLSVYGVCVENVEIPENVTRLVLDGSGTATIRAADPAVDTIMIYGDDITVRGFTLTGGRDGVTLRGALNVVVEHNAIHGNGRIGVNVHRVSYALIVGNTIRDNRSFGIVLMENASARIGFKETTAPSPNPNVIEANGSDGIYVARSSNAWIAGNTIAGNARHGVYIEKSAQAEVMANTIDSNAGHGVFVTHNSGAHLGSGTGARWMDKPNTTTVPNSGFGIQCSVGAYLVGQLGSLNGMAGLKSVTTGCVDTVQ
jgi:parallel beta-helix repeat protein